MNSGCYAETRSLAEFLSVSLVEMLLFTFKARLLKTNLLLPFQLVLFSFSKHILLDLFPPLYRSHTCLYFVLFKNVSLFLIDIYICAEGQKRTSVK